MNEDSSESAMAHVLIDNTITLQDVRSELAKARQKFPANNHMLAALMEEVGELSQALLEQEQEPEKQIKDIDIYKEAIQVACVAIRIASEGDAAFPKFDPEKAFHQQQVKEEKP